MQKDQMRCNYRIEYDIPSLRGEETKLFAVGGELNNFNPFKV